MPLGLRTMHSSVLRSLAVVAIASLTLLGCSDPIASSHTSANVPEAGEFDAILKRDLRAYAKSVRVDVSEVRHKLLRKGPTQSGVSEPKYYAWIELLNSAGEVVDSGAARLTASDRSRFEVTHFISVSEIQANPDGLKSVFPETLCKNIEARAATK